MRRPNMVYDAKRKRRWFFTAEIAVLICIVCVWVFKPARFDINSIEATVHERVVKTDDRPASVRYSESIGAQANAITEDRPHDESMEKPSDCPAILRSGLSPERMVLDQINQGRAALKNRYRIIFSEINRRGPMLGQERYNAMIAQQIQRARLEVAEFERNAQATLAPYQQIDMLEAQGMIDPDRAREAKWRMLLPKDTEQAVFPKPSK